ncbi:MAG: hypothetical protein QM737_03965 [Ferruginibacter sp.]
MRKIYFILYTCCLLPFTSMAQDTINTNNLKLNTAAFKTGSRSYAVFFTDSLGKRISSADIWDRKVNFLENNKTFEFTWQWWRKDTLMGDVKATGHFPSFKMISHEANYRNRGQSFYVFNNDVVTVPAIHQLTAKDSAFKVTLDPAGFEFPMDLELLPLIPFKKTGQEFLMAFYEPGTPKADYYKLTVTGKEDVELPAGAKVNCWMLKIDYAPGTYATFWISDKTREVVKMKEFFRGRYRNKLLLY